MCAKALSASAKSTRAKSAKHKPSTAHAAPAIRVISGKWRGLKLYMPDPANSKESKAPASSTPSKHPTHAQRDSATTRPTKSIVKESFFNTLAHEICGACFIEGFAGSGSMGIEALSRGARVGVFCEQDARALDTLWRNLALLPIATHSGLDLAKPMRSMKPARLDSGVSARAGAGGVVLGEQAETAQRAYVLRGDSFASLPAVLTWLESSAITGVLYLDPPFCIRENYGDIYEKCANLIAFSGVCASSSLRHIIIEHSSAYAFAEQIGRFIQYRVRRFGKSTLTYFTQGA